MQIMQRLLDAINYSRARLSGNSINEGDTNAAPPALNFRWQSSPQLEALLNPNLRQSLQRTEVFPHYKCRRSHWEKRAFGVRSCTDIWKCHSVNTTGKFNKVFAAQWIDDNRVIFGTKDNKLQLLILRKGKESTFHEIALPELQSSAEHADLEGLNCGMHDIACHPGTNRVATGGAKTNEICILRYDDEYDTANITPVRVLRDHDDWIFGLEWLNRDILMSGGRDGKLNVWYPGKMTARPHHTHLMKEQEGIRAIKYHPQNGKAILLTVNGQIQIWDAATSKTVWKRTLQHSKEAVCVCLNHERGSIVCGSQSHLTVLDPREPDCKFRSLPSVDKGWGVRTVSVDNHDLMTIGGGLGRISFYDFRKNDYLKIGEKSFLEVETGWIKQDDIFMDIFMEHQLPTPTAVYAHCYSPNLGKLFVAGGPTPFGLHGSFVSVFS